MPKVNFCLNCGHAMEERTAFGKVRQVCPACGRVHFVDPKVAAAVLLERDGKVLLTRRVNDPRRGLWVTPGGFVDADEDPQAAAARECEEETGLKIEIVELLDVLSTRGFPNSASIVIFYQGKVVGGELRAGDDADRVEWFGQDELPEFAFESTRAMLERWKKKTQIPGTAREKHARPKSQS